MPAPTLSRDAEVSEVFAPTPEAIPHQSCDRCGPAVPARYTASLNGSDLFFCGHHIRKFADKLRAANFVITPDDISYDWNRKDKGQATATAPKITAPRPGGKPQTAGPDDGVPA